MSRVLPVIAASIALFFTLPLLPAVASADAVRCGDKLAVDGDTPEQVRAKCGEPDTIDNHRILQYPSYWRHGRQIFFGDFMVEVPVELWTYNFGPNKFMRRLKFVGGRLTEVETLGYGYLPR